MDPSYDLSPSFGWVAKPKCVPKCLVSHLTLIKFDGCLGSLNELEFTGHVLQNGLVLKTVLIACAKLNFAELHHLKCAFPASLKR
ncbi:hypothetical protein P8452_75224 [Trifolium repens]|nr:hypothetical protein P8452_75224 [Trifolium repens]